VYSVLTVSDLEQSLRYNFPLFSLLMLCKWVYWCCKYWNYKR